MEWLTKPIVGLYRVGVRLHEMGPLVTLANQECPLNPPRAAMPRICANIR
jgi:hypothetical protein